MRSRKASFTCPDRSRAVMSLSCGGKGGGRGGEGGEREGRGEERGGEREERGRGGKGGEREGRGGEGGREGRRREGGRGEGGEGRGRGGEERGGEGRGRGEHLQFPHILNAYLGYNFSDFLVAMETTESGSLALGQVKCAEGGALSQRAQVQRVAAVGHTNTHHLHTDRVWFVGQ